MTVDGNLSLWWGFPLLLAVYTISAWHMVILDCDETFNYLEPLHFLLQGHGFQTWEYAPSFALRPYSFLLPFAKILSILGKTFKITDKVNTFAFNMTYNFSGCCVQDAEDECGADGGLESISFP